MRNSYFRGHWSGRKPPQGTLRYLQWAEKTRGHCHLRCLGVAELAPLLDPGASVGKQEVAPSPVSPPA